MIIPPVSRYMTRSPHVVAPRDKLTKARSLMRRHQIHHLPVVDADARLVGIVSDHDVGAQDDKVIDAMTHDVVTVDANATLDEVVALMQTGRINSVVVTGNAGIEGIFTATDAVRALGDVLERVEIGER
jgi:CBS domain-containing membrane protein